MSQVRLGGCSRTSAENPLGESVTESEEVKSLMSSPTKRGRAVVNVKAIISGLTSGCGWISRRPDRAATRGRRRDPSRTTNDNP